VGHRGKCDGWARGEHSHSTAGRWEGIHSNVDPRRQSKELRFPNWLRPSIRLTLAPCCAGAALASSTGAGAPQGLSAKTLVSIRKNTVKIGQKCHEYLYLCIHLTLLLLQHLPLSYDTIRYQIILSLYDTFFLFMIPSLSVHYFLFWRYFYYRESNSSKERAHVPPIHPTA
jgi:hypothetical protein